MAVYDREKLSRQVSEVIANFKIGDDCAVDVMRSGTNVVLNRIKSEFDADIQERSQALVNRFTSNVANCLNDVTTSWVDANSQQLMVVPEGTRFVQTDDNYTNIMVEQKPQCRRITFALAGVEHHFYLSFPFVQFIFSFNRTVRSETLNVLSVSCTKTSVKTLADNVCYLPLPNISMHRVCVGSDSNGMQMPNTVGHNITEKVSTIISSYWQSQFNMDLRDNLTAFLTSNFTSSFNGNDYVAGFKAWEQKSKENGAYAITPEFVLQDSRYKISDLIVSNLVSRTGKQSLINKMKEIINGGLVDISSSATKSINSINILDLNSLQPHMQAVKKWCEGTVKSAYDLLWREIHDKHAQQVTMDTLEIESKKRDLEYQVRNSASIIESIQQTRVSFETEKIKVQNELYFVHNYLSEQAEKLQELQAKLSQYVDEQGNPVAKKRGRRVKQPIANEVVDSLNRAASSHIVVGPNEALPVKRKRGRPRKNV